MARIDIEMEGLGKLLQRIDQLQGNSEEIASKALTKVHEDVTQRIHADMEKHHRTGDTEEQIEDTAEVNWLGKTAYVKVGFQIDNATGKGLASVFLLYGTPKMDPDRKLYNDFFGPSTRKRIKETEENVLYEELRRLELL